jgi:uncharacterized damage-inducible protein DinB
MQLSAEPHDPEKLRQFFQELRAATKKELAQRSDADLATPIAVPHAPGVFPLRWWLWFILEHEIHHKAQLAVYARAMGHVPPYYALALPKGQRPDMVAR